MNSVFKPQAPFERLKFSNYSPEVALRKAIILQAIIDSTSTSDTEESRKIELSAKKWLFNKSQNFVSICLDGQLQPDFVIKVAKEMIRQHTEENNKMKRRKGYTKNNTLSKRNVKESEKENEEEFQDPFYPKNKAFNFYNC